jgi:hypothetical protein
MSRIAIGMSGYRLSFDQMALKDGAFAAVRGAESVP